MFAHIIAFYMRKADGQMAFGQFMRLRRSLIRQRVGNSPPAPGPAEVATVEMRYLAIAAI